MKETILHSYDFNLRYAKELVADIEEEMMTHSPVKGLENHPAFTLGHLISGAALTSKYLGGPYTMDPQWEALFRRKGPGDPRKPNPNAALYPSKAALLAALSHQHQLVEGLIRELHEARLQEAASWRYEQYFPTLGELLHFMCITHEAMHLGQLAGWRRAMDLPSALARL